MEILDYEEVPALIREPVRISLSLTQSIAGLSRILKSELLDALLDLNTPCVFELGSGSGHNLSVIASECVARGYNNDVVFVLSDKFVSLHAWQKHLSKNQNLIAFESSLDFNDLVYLEDQTEGRRLVFLLISASHHMNDRCLAKFLATSAKLGAHVVVLEPLERCYVHALLAMTGSLAGLISPFLPQLSLCERLKQAVIYYSGLGLFVQSYDGVISTLRQRNKHQFKNLCQSLPYELLQKNKLGPLKNYTLTIFKHQRPHM